MKKIFLVFISLILLSSCASKSDEIPTPEELIETKDPLIGIWKLTHKNTISITDICQKKDSYTFVNNGYYIFNDYNNTNNLCAKDEKSSYKGYWKNNKNNTYNFKKHGYTGNGADLNITFSEDKQEFTFPSNGLTYKRQ
ncbi:hypothetical protein [Tenacibaculum finnmarkense]|uniref:hypothetical protein n=1 Tax=Tenacibaculum finnmarkense TaxID=2781243 RepID=UPI00187B3FA6|nr:hypothetical protein [Tenacibaculum finnmarkense]MBE7659912.1 hypothetical protein [Tenacibaculum finnmarkense genomovar finnmarkense]MCG8251598.1 hypothetical protein [Tenacibaculum finnmarkense genomovar finnmarkense]MCG8815126.1 hypothetical protein [Tenacibaculum finnmarkense]MCG8820074.1 hypothetical protein [Tenacibaculum finnmarkense]